MIDFSSLNEGTSKKLIVMFVHMRYVCMFVFVYSTCDMFYVVILFALYLFLSVVCYVLF